ncbi:MAG: DUF1800 family protein [Micropruina glycogenica]
MGQVFLRPPSVGGWLAARGWLSSGTAAARLVLATWVATAATLLTGTAKARVAAGPTSGADAWLNRTADALAGCVADRPAQLVALAACSPEYIVSQQAVTSSHDHTHRVRPTVHTTTRRRFLTWSG